MGYRGEGSRSKSIKERNKNQKGFTILELMVVGAILGILAGIAVPIYHSYLKRARQVEAPVALNEVKRLESLYFAFNGGYATLDEIGYHPSTALRYYTVTLELIPPSNGQPASFTATAAGNIDSDPDEDIWTIIPDGTLRHVQAD
ncbi:MAG: prepilin-type N-terminal cleavage/methylation domain-containing protein [Nitrospirae bacterium]|nr:prepilin-type N-terminal cleavage/methylation domain-containing protein [Nitrospirota bacterium]